MNLSTPKSMSPDTFQQACLRDGITIPARMQSAMEMELSAICQHIETVNKAINTSSEPANIFHLATVVQS